MKSAKIFGFLGLILILFVGFNFLLDVSLIAQWAGPLTQNPEEVEGAQGESTNTSEELADCSGVIIQIEQASTDSVTAQIAGGNINTVSATWFYSESPPVTVEGEVTNGEATIQSDNPGETLNNVEVNAPECPGAAPANYYP